MRLAGKSVFVTAAGQGIGRAIAETAIAQGADVTATDLNAALLDGLPCTTAALDVTDAAAVAALLGAKRTDVLVNCAGYVHTDTVLEQTEADLDFAFMLNVRSMIHTIKAALPAMLDAGSGSIVNIASVASSTKGFPNRCSYGLTKGAVIGLTKSVAADYIKRGIRCNCISPGTVDSPSLQDRLKASGDYEAALTAFVARQPMGRLGTVAEIAHLAIYLASDESGYMTGQDICIDGGITG